MKKKQTLCFHCLAVMPATNDRARDAGWWLTEIGDGEDENGRWALGDVLPVCPADACRREAIRVGALPVEDFLEAN